MLSLRAEQVWLIEADAEARFRAKLREHLAAHFPGACAALDAEQLDAVLDHGLARARAHGFERERELAKYLGLVFAFGRDFDREQAWAARLLAAGASIERLHAVALLNENRALGRV